MMGFFLSVVFRFIVIVPTSIKQKNKIVKEGFSFRTPFSFDIGSCCSIIL